MLPSAAANLPSHSMVPSSLADSGQEASLHLSLGLPWPTLQPWCGVGDLGESPRRRSHDKEIMLVMEGSSVLCPPACCCSTPTSNFLKLLPPAPSSCLVAASSRLTSTQQLRHSLLRKPICNSLKRAGSAATRNSASHCPPPAWLSAVHSTPRADSVCASSQRFKSRLGAPIGRTADPSF